MRNGTFIALVVITAFLGSQSLGIHAASAEAKQSGAGEVPRRADGRPDLGGVWDFRSSTPLERPAEVGDETGQEVGDETGQAEEAADETPLERGLRIGAYNQFWSDAGTPVPEDARASLIVDPPDGRIPSLRPGALRQVGSYMEEDLESTRPIRYRGGGISPDGPEDRGLAERCLLGFNTGPPVIPGGYNENIQIFQTADYVVVFHEMVHDARIVPLDGRPHLPNSVRQWMGDPRGYWDGDTLVIESTNFSDKTMSFNDSLTSGFGTGKTLHLTERFRRINGETLEYEFTVNDPVTFTQPFTGIIPMTKNQGQVYEFACHEGNYGLIDILAGARAEEAATQGSR